MLEHLMPGAPTTDSPFTIVTGTGRRVDLASPRPDQIALKDLARRLAYEYRWAGDGREKITVAEHSFVAAQAMNYKCRPIRLQRLALLHDAHEAYLKDMPTPAKDLLPGYRDLCNSLQAAILAAFGLDPPTPDEEEELKVLDLELRAHEIRGGFAPAGVRDMGVLTMGLPHLVGFTPEGAEQNFMDVARALGLREAL